MRYLIAIFKEFKKRKKACLFLNGVINRPLKNTFKNEEKPHVRYSEDTHKSLIIKYFYQLT
jgi:hypothetical protein